MSELLSTLGSSQYAPFSVALLIMVFLAILQIVGVSDMADGEIDIDADGETEAGGLIDGLNSLIGIGRVPFTIWLATLLFFFAGLGFGIQALAQSILGAPLYGWLAALGSGVASLPVTGGAVRPLARILPGDETSAVGIDSLIGRRARITEGTARRGSPARAKVRDIHGQAHYVMAEPHGDTASIAAGERVLLVRREGGTFFAAPLDERQLAPAD
ncbi:MAG: YqiJ family protein [Alteripontixanthobacter sp.]